MSREVDKFISSLDNETLNKIRHSLADAEARRILSSKVVKPKLTLSTERWEHTCGDGCCYSEGTEVRINGEAVTNGYFGDTDTLLRDTLEFLGYQVEVEGED